MKAILPVSLGLVLATATAFGQAGVGIRERAKELSRQNNVRQGVATPAQPPQQPAAPTPAQPGTAAPKPTITQAEAIAKLQGSISVFKAGTAVTPDQKTQLIKDMAVAMRGKKASLPTVQKAVDTLTAALSDGTLGAPEQKRLATDIDGIVNAAGATAEQFDGMVNDVQAVLQVGQVKRNIAVVAAADLKAVGAEVRR